jgi:polysaccharide biosynthesis/export protein
MKRTISLIVMLFVLTVLGIPDGAAQTPTPTPAQMEMFRQLPPAEQERLMREYGGQARRPQADEARARADRPAPNRAKPGRTARQGTRRAEPVIDPATGLCCSATMFRRAPEAFAPVLDIPVPDGLHARPRRRGPGAAARPHARRLHADRQSRRRRQLPRARPDIGGRLAFDDARQLMQERVAQQMIGVPRASPWASCAPSACSCWATSSTRAPTRVSSLSTMTHALLASGGISPIGSLRNIQLKRDGDLVARLTFTTCCCAVTPQRRPPQAGRRDLRAPGGPQVGVDGEVRRPGMYELKGSYDGRRAGVTSRAGFRPRPSRGAPPSSASTSTRNASSRTSTSAPPREGAGAARGRFAQVPSVLERVDNAVELVGHVFRPTRVQYRPGMRISRPGALAARAEAAGRCALPAHPARAGPTGAWWPCPPIWRTRWRTPGSEADVPLQPGRRCTCSACAGRLARADEAGGAGGGCRHGLARERSSGASACGQVGRRAATRCGVCARAAPAIGPRDPADPGGECEEENEAARGASCRS